MSKIIPTEFQQDLIHGNVKAAMKNVSASSGDLWRVPLEELHALPGLNVRTKNDDYDAHILRLARSMVEEGFYPDKSIAVFIAEDGKIIVRDGHSRVEAARLANTMGAQITVLPCITAPRGTTMTDIMVGLVKSNTGKPLLPIEVAVVCKRLMGWGWDAKAIAERLDYSPGYVNDLVGLLEAPAALQSLVAAGKTSAATVIKQIKKEGPAKAAETITKASAEAVGGKVTAKTLKGAAELTAPQLTALLRDVFDDAAFHDLDDRLQDRILGLFD